MSEKLIKGLKISLESKGGGGRVKKHEATTVLVTKLHNRTTGRPAGELVMTYGSGHDESIDNLLPIDPSTGKQVEALQQPLPEPKKK